MGLAAVRKQSKVLFIFDPSQSEEEISPLPLKMFVQFYAQQLIFRDL